MELEVERVKGAAARGQLSSTGSPAFHIIPNVYFHGGRKNIQTILIMGVGVSLGKDAYISLSRNVGGWGTSFQTLNHAASRRREDQHKAT